MIDHGGREVQQVPATNSTTPTLVSAVLVRNSSWRILLLGLGVPTLGLALALGLAALCPSLSESPLGTLLLLSLVSVTILPDLGLLDLIVCSRGQRQILVDRDGFSLSGRKSETRVHWDEVERMDLAMEYLWVRRIGGKRILVRLSGLTSHDRDLLVETAVQRSGLQPDESIPQGDWRYGGVYRWKRAKVSLPDASSLQEGKECATAPSTLTTPKA